MKPKTKIEIRIVELSAKLPKITEKQQQWSSNNSFDKWAVVSRKKLHCLECGHSWNDDSPAWHNEIVNPKCENCNNVLKMFRENKPRFSEMEYFAILSKKAEFQVVRIIASHKHMRKNEAPTYFHSEVMQHWIDVNGEVRTMSKNVQSFSQCYDAWIFQTELEIKPKCFKFNPRYKLNPWKIYPVRSVAPIIKRNGFKGSFHDIQPQILFSALLINPISEYLQKTNQINLLKYHLIDSDFGLEKHFSSIKICNRNGYIIKDFGTWRDYLELLKYFKKDLHNPKYVCPIDLDNAHDRLVEKKRKIQKREKYERIKQEIEVAQVKYFKQKESFFDLEFTHDKLTIKVIKNVQDFMELGDILKHCIFTNQYYERQNSLVFSAFIDNKPIETIEVSLSDMKILQARGEGNKPSKHNLEIVGLVNDNLDKIRARFKNKRKSKKPVII